jgi:hypothetical protein
VKLSSTRLVTILPRCVVYDLANGNGTLHAFKLRPNGSLESFMVPNGVADLRRRHGRSLTVHFSIAHQQLRTNKLLMSRVKLQLRPQLKIMSQVKWLPEPD